MSTLEARLRDHFARLAEQDQASPSISIAAATRRGRRRLRWRRTRLTGGPVLAVSAVLALTLASVLPAGRVGSTTPPAGRADQATTSTAAPRQFNPLLPYASFGRLPAGERIGSGGDGTVMDYLNVYAGGTFEWQLSTFARDACLLKDGTELLCTLPGPATQPFLLAGRAPSVNGRPTFWVRPGQHQSVAWQYAASSWAVLGNAKGSSQPADGLLRTAGAVVFGARTQRPIEFAAQFTEVPATWRISSDSFRPVSGTEQAYQYLFVAAGSNPLDLPFVTVSLGKGSCYFYPGGQSVHRVIDGYHVVVNSIPAARGNPTSYQVCAPDADGLFVFISVNGGRPVIGPVALFRHLRLLGTDPARWVTRPTS